MSDWHAYCEQCLTIGQVVRVEVDPLTKTMTLKHQPCPECGGKGIIWKGEYDHPDDQEDR